MGVGGGADRGIDRRAVRTIGGVGMLGVAGGDLLQPLARDLVRADPEMGEDRGVEGLGQVGMI